MTGRGNQHFLREIGMADRSFPSFFAVIIVSIFVLTSFNLSAQKNTDIGLFAGTAYYMGDLNPSVHYAAPTFAVGPIFRYNFNPRNSLRAHGFYHGLRGSDEDYMPNISPGRGAEFNSKFVDLGFDFEFNWKAYKTAYRRTKSSPYVFVGLGFGLNLVTQNLPIVTMPFGLGYKLNVGKWLSVGAEVSARKTFTDLIDGVTNPQLEGSIEPFGNNDWYYFTGVFVTYKIFKFAENCPAYEDN
jgi:hypothetical protein